VGGEGDRPVRRLPRELWACVIVAIASALLWSIASPWFHPPDESNHVGYVKHLVEAGALPRTGAPPNPPGGPREEIATAVTGVRFQGEGKPPYEPAYSRALQEQLDGPVAEEEEAAAGNASNNPPLYYLYEAAPYALAQSANVFDRILLLRLWSSLLAGLTVAFVFLFLRELLPGTRWAWTVGALAVALQPVFGFVSGSVNPDALLWSAAAALFYASARILRQGLTWRRAAGLLVALIAGLLTKGAMLGLVPGAALVLAVGAWRLGGTRARRVLFAGAVAVACAAFAVVFWVAVTSSLHGTATGAGTTGGVKASGFDLAHQINYVWQTYLPQLPFQNDLFEGYPLWNVYFQGFVGRFGHFFVDFPGWVNWLGLAVALGVLVLAGRALWLYRAALRPRLGELAAYVGMVAGLLILLGIAGFQFREREGFGLEQTRYLLPLLPLYGALVAVAARGAGRWARHVGLGLVALFAAHTVFALLLTVGHYYG
jgi:4-amino-4-deoxy-L-arabinose transferase-like glycosyltransferase